MFGMMRGDRLEVASNHGYDLRTVVDSSIRKPFSDIDAFACSDKKSATIMLWNYHDDDVKMPAEKVSLELKNIPSKQVRLTHYRIDDDHSNSYEAWKKMGSPQQPTAEQISILEKAGMLQTIEKQTVVKTSGGFLQLNFSLPRQAVSFLKLSW
jgi:xylan 1,4-beta-xylosidase